jgi:hypothetical protein
VGNEYNLPADLPNAAEHRPQIAPDRGTALRRSAQDEVSHRDIRSVLKFVAEQIREYDPHRMIASGNAFPRPSAWHQERYRTWAPDTDGQFAEMLAADNPSPIDSLSGHLYRETGQRFGMETTYEPLIAAAMRTAAATRKPLFVGEFGVEQSRTAEEFDAMLSAMVKAKVPLGAVWVYDFPEQDSDWNITGANSRAWQLRRLTETNDSVRTAPR